MYWQWHSSEYVTDISILMASSGKRKSAWNKNHFLKRLKWSWDYCAIHSLLLSVFKSSLSFLTKFRKTGALLTIISKWALGLRMNLETMLNRWALVIPIEFPNKNSENFNSFEFDSSENNEAIISAWFCVLWNTAWCRADDLTKHQRTVLWFSSIDSSSTSCCLINFESLFDC